MLKRGQPSFKQFLNKLLVLCINRIYMKVQVIRLSET